MTKTITARQPDMSSIIASDHVGLLYLLLPDQTLVFGSWTDVIAALAFAAFGLSATAIALIAGFAPG
jgi:hypothetical protein